MSSSPAKTTPIPTSIAFATSGLGGMMGWVVVHPFNTISIRMNLATASISQAGETAAASPLSFSSYFLKMVKEEGALSLYNGLSAGLLRQIFYATSRFGLFEVIRDELAKVRETDMLSRFASGVSSGGIAALISCPAEVTLVRISNDNSLPPEKRRNYTGVANAFSRILREEGVKTFFSGSGPFVNRAMLVGAVQVGTYDQFKDTFRKEFGITSALSLTMCASMASGLIYSIVTMPFETAKNRMAFQKPDPVTNIKPYRTTGQTIGTIVSKEGVLRLWSGFPPYYLRCGGHTVFMFMAVEALRNYYTKGTFAL